MKPLVGGKLRLDEISPQPLSRTAAVRAAGFGGVRIPEPPAATGSCKVYCMVVGDVSSVWDWYWLGDVSIFALIEVKFGIVTATYTKRFERCGPKHSVAPKLTAIFRGW